MEHTIYIADVVFAADQIAFFLNVQLRKLIDEKDCLFLVDMLLIVVATYVWGPRRYGDQSRVTVVTHA